jgi:thioredoxin 1
MKKNVFIAVAVLVGLASASMIVINNDANLDKKIPQAETAVNNKIEENHNVSNMEKLTKAAFLEKVFNYEQNKEWKYEGELPCLIDFYADWCGPCKMVHPILVELSKEYDGKIKIYQIDTEAEQELAAAFGIRSIPSLLFCPTEGQPQMAQGALPKATLKKAIHEILLVEDKATTN